MLPYDVPATELWKERLLQVSTTLWLDGAVTPAANGGGHTPYLCTTTGQRSLRSIA